LTSDEVAKLTRACSSRSSSGLRNRALIATLYRAGLRVGEALKLGPNDVDPRGRTILRDRTHPSRPLVLDAGSFRLIETWMERRDTLGLSASAPLFCTLKGKPLASSYLRGLLGRLATKAGIDKPVSAEVLRRSLALELVEEGFPLTAIQAQLGHSTAAVTSRYLARLGTAGDPGEVPRRADWRP
jgi:integrase/recombinase XerC